MDNGNQIVPTNALSSYRVFVSYSHDDSTIVHVIAKYLEHECHLTVIWDQTFAVGRGFHEQIRDCIAHAHIFLPVLTPRATERGWVHQEIGFAMAMNIPVLPIAINASPGQMISLVHAVKLDAISDTEKAQLAEGLDQSAAANDLSVLKSTKLWQRLRENLPRQKMERLIHNHADTNLARYECADFHEERTSLMVRNANAAYDLQQKGLLVRQLGGLSSFHIPAEEPSNEIWNCRYGAEKRGNFHKKMQRTERSALERHACEAGCRLIINPYHRYAASGPRAYAVRLLCMLQFLRSWNHTAPLHVAINHRLGTHESVTIVGDFFSAIAVSGSASSGYMQTVFTTHAPSMKCRQEQFDQTFAESLKDWNWQAEDSRERAADEIERILSDILHVRGDMLSSPVVLTRDIPDNYEDWPATKTLEEKLHPPERPVTPDRRREKRTKSNATQV